MRRSAFFRKRMSRASYIPTKSKTLSSLPAFDHELTRLQGMASHAQRAGFLALAAALIIIPALFLPDANFIDPRSNLSVPILGIGELSLWTGMMVVTIIYCASVFYEQLFWLQLFKEKKHPAFGSVVSFHFLKGIGFRFFQSILLILPLLIALLLIYKALPFPQVETKILIILCMGIIFIRFAVIVAMAPFFKAKLFIQVLIFFSIVLLGFSLLLLHTVFMVRTNEEPEWYQRNIWLSKANFSTSDNTRVDLRNKVFNRAIILDSDFGKADLRGASFVKSEITYSLFDHTQLGSTNNFIK